MAKVDFRKTLKQLYAPGKAFAFVEVPNMQFVKIDGKGDPNTAADYRTGLQWLYSVSYAMKFASKKRGKDYVVPPLEGLWFADDLTAFRRHAKGEWRWTQMIMVPEWVTRKDFAAAVTEASKKLGEPPSSLRFEPFAEGPSVQFMHTGPWADEGPMIARMHEEFIPDHGLAPNGHHHEIYLSDPRRTAPAKLKTIVRQPVKKAPARKAGKAA